MARMSRSVPLFFSILWDRVFFGEVFLLLLRSPTAVLEIFWPPTYFANRSVIRPWKGVTLAVVNIILLDIVYLVFFP